MLFLIVLLLIDWNFVLGIVDVVLDFIDRGYKCCLSLVMFSWRKR